MTVTTDFHSWGDVTVSIGWSAGAGVMGMMIRAADEIQYAGQIYPARFNHVFYIFHFERGPDLLWESTGRHGVCMSPAKLLEDARQAGKVMYYYTHNLGLCQKMATKLWIACEALHGKPYDHLHILGLLHWIRFRGRDQTRRPWWLRTALNARYICSEFTEVAGRMSGTLDLCGDISTPVTTTPESQFLKIIGLPSAIAYRPGARNVYELADFLHRHPQSAGGVLA